MARVTRARAANLEKYEGLPRVCGPLGRPRSLDRTMRRTSIMFDALSIIR